MSKRTTPKKPKEQKAEEKRQRRIAKAKKPQRVFSDRKTLTTAQVAARDDWFPSDWPLPNTEENRLAMCEMMLAKAEEVLAPLPNGKGSKLSYITSKDFGAGPNAIGLLAALPFAGNVADGPFDAGIPIKAVWVMAKGPEGLPRSLDDVQYVLDDPKQFSNQLIAFCSARRSYSFDEARTNLRVIVNPPGTASRADIQVKFSNPIVPFRDPESSLGLRIHNEADGSYRSLGPLQLQAWVDESGLSAEAICDMALLNTAATLGEPTLPASATKYAAAAIKSGKLTKHQHQALIDADRVLPICLFFSKPNEHGKIGDYISALINFPQYLFDDIPEQGLLLAAPDESEIMAVRMDALQPPEDVADQITLEQIEEAVERFLDMFTWTALLRGAHEHRNITKIYYWSPAYPDGLRTIKEASDEEEAKKPSSISYEEFLSRVVEPMR